MRWPVGRNHLSYLRMSIRRTNDIQKSTEAHALTDVLQVGLSRLSLQENAGIAAKLIFDEDDIAAGGPMRGNIREINDPRILALVKSGHLRVLLNADARLANAVMTIQLFGQRSDKYVNQESMAGVSREEQIEIVEKAGRSMRRIYNFEQSQRFEYRKIFPMTPYFRVNVWFLATHPALYNAVAEWDDWVQERDAEELFGPLEGENPPASSSSSDPQPSVSTQTTYVSNLERARQLVYGKMLMGTDLTDEEKIFIDEFIRESIGPQLESNQPSSSSQQPQAQQQNGIENLVQAYNYAQRRNSSQARATTSAAKEIESHPMNAVFNHIDKYIELYKALIFLAYNVNTEKEAFERLRRKEAYIIEKHTIPMPNIIGNVTLTVSSEYGMTSKGTFNSAIYTSISNSNIRWKEALERAFPEEFVERNGRVRVTRGRLPVVLITFWEVMGRMEREYVKRIDSQALSLLPYPDEIRPSRAS